MIIIEAKEFYKKLHPEQFSDSKIITTSNITESFLDYYFDTITNRSQEYQFQEFCRELAQKEICPNLIPQTGPTGGGDSKVDTETFPVSNSIAELWYDGINRNSSCEKWAFAISAKKSWKDKVKKDVEKIINTNRGYVRIFFMSNQYISDKNRSIIEDELTIQYKLNISILDKNWIIKKIIENNNLNLVSKYFNVANEEKIDVGQKDFQRSKELENTETDIKNCKTDLKLFDLLKKSCILSRELELSIDEINGKFSRYYNIAKKKNTFRQIFDCLYEWAWTLNFWYNDKTDFYLKYLLIEEGLSNFDSLYYIDKVVNLWMVLNNPTFGDNVDINKHKQIIVGMLCNYINNKNNPNSAFNANTILLRIKMIIAIKNNENPDSLVDEYLNVFTECDGIQDFDLNNNSKIALENPFLKTSTKYEDLFELVTKKTGDAEQELFLARKLYGRGIEIILENPYRAITYFGRAIIKLYKHESKEEFISNSLSMGFALEEVGLKWAARQYYILALSHSIKNFHLNNEFHSALFIASSALKNLELEFGRIIYASELDRLEMVFRNIGGYPEKEKSNFEVFLAILVCKTNFEHLNKLELLPEYFSDNNQEIINICLRYLLGYYDEGILASDFNNDKNRYDEFIGQIYHQPAREQLGIPFWGIEQQIILKSSVLGCEIFCVVDNNLSCIELASSILGGLESFLATAINYKMIATKNTLKIRIAYVNSLNYEINIVKNSEYDLFINSSDYDKGNIIDNQDLLLKEISVIVFYIIFNIIEYDVQKKLKEIILKEDGFNRALTISSNFFIFADMLSKEFFSFEDKIKPDFEKYKLIRDCLPNFIGNDDFDIPEREMINLNNYVFSKSEKDFDFKNVKQSDIKNYSLINIKLWDNAKWIGVAYINHPTQPAIILIFENIEFGKKIFEEWIKKTGRFDSKDEILIYILKGINILRPFDYRFTIQGNIKNIVAVKRTQLFLSAQRNHTMNVESIFNLDNFSKVWKNNDFFYIMPGTINKSTNKFQLAEELCIKKNKDSLKICLCQDLKEENIMELNCLIPSDNPNVQNPNHPSLRRLAEMNSKKD